MRVMRLQTGQRSGKTSCHLFSRDVYFVSFDNQKAKDLMKYHYFRKFFCTIGLSLSKTDPLARPLISLCHATYKLAAEKNP